MKVLDSSKSAFNRAAEHLGMTAPKHWTHDFIVHSKLLCQRGRTLVHTICSVWDDSRVILKSELSEMSMCGKRGKYD